MKLLHLVQCYYPALGGSEGLARHLSEQMVARYGDQVTVYTSANYNAESFWRGRWPVLPTGVEEINGVTVRRFRVYAGMQRVRGLLARGSRRLNLPYNDWLRTIEIGPIIREFPQAIAAHESELVFATAFPFLHMYYAVAGARRAGKPVVLLGAIHTADRWGYDRQNMIEAIRRADAYIAHTEHERSYLAARGVDPAKMHVIGGGVHAATYAQADGAAMRRHYGWGDDPVVAVLARQSSLKRIDLAIRAMPLVWGVYPRARLLLAGARTSYTPQLEALVRGLPPDQQHRITFVHNFAEEEKPHLLAAADLVAHPSINESFAIALVEAWGCAKPVIGGDVGAVPSVITPGVDGLIFRYPDPASLAQAIVVLLSNPDQAARMGAAGQAKVMARYTWDRVTHQVRAVYDQVLAARRSEGSHG